MVKEYVVRVGPAYRVAGTRISLDSIVIDFLNGISPEGIVDNFPGLTLEQVYGAITFYLANRSDIDLYIAEGRIEFEAQRRIAREKNPLLYRKLEDATRNLPVK